MMQLIAGIDDAIFDTDYRDIEKIHTMINLL